MKRQLLIVFLVASLELLAQGDIPIGTWRTHFSFNTVTEVLEADDRVYAVGKNGLFYLDRKDNSISTIGKIDGLQEDNISALGYDTNKAQLIIGYSSGNIDIISANEIVSLDLVSNSQVLGSKGINHIFSFENQAFIATDYGLLNIDLNKLEVRETYRQLGRDAEQIAVNQSNILGDSIYLATEVGIIASNFRNGVNLFDPINWRRFDTQDGITTGTFPFILNFQQRLIAFSSDSAYQKVNDSWQNMPELSGVGYSSISSNNDILTAVFEGEIINIDMNYNERIISDPLIQAPNDVLFADNQYYIADGVNGLVVGTEQNFISAKPSGPSTNNLFRFFSNTNSIYSLPGGYDGSRLPLQNDEGFNVFENGSWKSSRELGLEVDFRDITDAAYDNRNNSYYYSSFGDGILAVGGVGLTQIYDSTNSTLSSVSGQLRTNYVSAITMSNEGLWVINYGAPSVLHLFSSNQWQSFSLLTSNIIDIINSERYLWMIVDRNAGGGILIFEKESGRSRYLTDQPGNGGLPSDIVNTIDVDLEGKIWVGTAKGVAVFNASSNFIEAAVDASLPIFENRFLLRDEVITSIEVDPGNRKWIGTENGVWLFDENADYQLQNFTEENSALPSNQIIDIAVVEKSGEVFFGTRSGIVSYRADASLATEIHEQVSVFPNPITSDYDGTVGISGLAYNVTIKITDSSGQLIWNTKAAGGTATWNARDYNGNRASTGIYFIFSATDDGEETFIGKIAVVN